MAYRKGETGNPGGRPSMKPWSEALMLAVKRSTEKGKKTKRLAVLADTCVKKGLAGDMQAIKEIGDRLDGKAAQSIEANLSGEVFFTTRVKRDPGS